MALTLVVSRLNPRTAAALLVGGAALLPLAARAQQPNVANPPQGAPVPVPSGDFKVPPVPLAINLLTAREQSVAGGKPGPYKAQLAVSPEYASGLPATDLKLVLGGDNSGSYGGIGAIGFSWQTPSLTLPSPATPVTMLYQVFAVLPGSKGEFPQGTAPIGAGYATLTLDKGKAGYLGTFVLDNAVWKAVNWNKASKEGEAYIVYIRGDAVRKVNNNYEPVGGWTTFVTLRITPTGVKL